MAMTKISNVGGYSPTGIHIISGIPAKTEISDKSAIFIGQKYQALVQQIQAIIKKTQGGATLSSTDAHTLESALNALKDLMTNGMMGQDPGTKPSQRYLTTYQAETLQVLFSSLAAMGIDPSKPISFGPNVATAQANATKWANWLSTPVSQPADQAINSPYITAANMLFSFAAGSPWMSMEAAVCSDWIKRGLDQFDAQMTQLNNAMNMLTAVLNNLNTLGGYQNEVKVQTPKDFADIFDIKDSAWKGDPSAFLNALKEALNTYGGNPLALDPNGAYVVPSGSLMDYLLNLKASGGKFVPGPRNILVSATPPISPELAQSMGITVKPYPSDGPYGPAGSMVTLEFPRSKQDWNVVVQGMQLITSGACTGTKDPAGNWTLTGNKADFVLFAAQQGLLQESVYGMKDNLLQMVDSLKSQISQLEEMVPKTPDGKEDPSGLTAKLRDVLKDVQTALNGATANSPPSVWAKGVIAFMTDNAGQNNAGAIHKHISIAQQAGSSLNDQQTNRIQQTLMTLTQFIQVATTILDGINQIRRTQAQNIAGR